MNWQSNWFLEPRHLHNIEECGSNPSACDQFHLFHSEKTWVRVKDTGSILRPFTEFGSLVIQSIGTCSHRTAAAIKVFH